MCGIAGFLDFKKTSSEEILRNMTACLSHRGPDGTGIYFDESHSATIGLGHRRLSIIDLSEGGAQPKYFDGLHVTFNGEIYNYQEIKNELEDLGHTFQSHSDTEVILHSYRQWGIKAVDRWKGMFALAMYDEKEKKFICIRDRAGVKPFYYYWKNDHFIFGSQLKSIMLHPAFEKNISLNSVASFLQYGYVSHPYSIFENTFKLSPGHYLVLDLNNKSIEVNEYWSVYDCYNQPRLNISFNDAVNETEKILSQAFQYRMVADVPVGVFLSGGYDSTCVTALLQKNATEKIKTFTIGNTDKLYNEAPFAKKIAETLGTDHTEYYCTPKEALDIIPDLPLYYDEPFADSSAIPTILVSRLARKKVTVALSADAGDEIFAGYNRYEYLLKYSEKISKVPRVMRRAMAGVMDKISSDDIPYFRKKYNFHSRYQKLRGLLHHSSLAEMMKSSVEAFSISELKTLFNADVTELSTNHISNQLSEKYFDPLSYMLAVDYQTYLTDDILQKVDRATMSIGLEGREPFLDQDIIKWVAQLPSDFKYNGETKKYLLKEIVHRHVPQEIMKRPKMGFSIPIDQWLMNELKPLVLEYFDSSKMQHGFFNTNEVAKIRDAFFSNKPNLHLKLWYILMFQMWYDKWMQ